MLSVRYSIEIGADTWSAPEHSRLLALRCHSDFRTPVNECALTMTYPVGISAALGDPVTVKLGHGDDLETVFTGIIGSIERQMDRLVIRAVSEAVKLLPARLNLFFEKTAAGDILSDICGQLDVPTGKVESGLDLSYYALGSNQSAAEHARYLAELCGYDLFSDENGELCFAPVEGDEHPFQFKVNILALSVDDPAPSVNGVEVFGDSTASKQGTDAAYWLSKKAVKTKAGEDDGLQQVFVGAARTEEHTKKIAEALLKKRAGKKGGTLKTLGNSAIRLGDTAKITKMPLDDQNGSYRVVGITHHITADKGFVSILKIESLEGAWSLSSLL